MRLHDLPRAEADRLVRGVAPEWSLSRSPSGEELDELFARAAWSVLAEPGDGVAGLLVEVLGAGRALALLRERSSPSMILRALAHGSSDESAGVSSGVLAAALERWMPRLSGNRIVNALRAAAVCSARLLTPGDEGVWPAGLADLGPFAPFALWVRGDPARFAAGEGAVALVGSRDATNYGEHVAMGLASGLCDAGVTVVSGAAYGIDGMAHRAALAAGGTTIAYLAGGIDRLYPAAHHDLLRRVMATGVVASEVPCGTPPTRWRFLQRNRLIAAGSAAVVVVEAGHRSGSLNTAGHAAALGRPLGAVPGPVTSSTSVGCHRLMREFDARCVTSAVDALELIRGFDVPVTRGVPLPRPAPSAAGSESTSGSVPGPAVASGLGGWSVPGAPSAAAASGEVSRRESADTRRVRDALSARAARGVDQVARSAGLSPRTVAAVLGTLALEGGAVETETGWKLC